MEKKKKKIGLERRKKKIWTFFFFGWATIWAQSLNGARGARGARLGRVWAPGKNPVP